MSDKKECCHRTVMAHCEGCPYIPVERCGCFRCKAAPPVAQGGVRDDDLLRRGDVIAMLNRLADQHADLALYGAPENARNRDAHEAAITRVKCAVALMDAVTKPAPTVAQGEYDGLITRLGIPFDPSRPDADVTLPMWVVDLLCDAHIALTALQAKVGELEADLAFHTCRPFVSGTGRDPITRQIKRMTVMDDETKASMTYLPEADAQARIAALEEALKQINNMGQSAVADHFAFRCRAREIARAALAKGGE